MAKSSNTATIRSKIQPSSLIIGLREALKKQPSAPMLKLWLDIVTDSLTIDGVYRQLIDQSQLSFLTIDVTGICDLTCPNMCYYHPEIDTHKPMVSEEALKKAILESGSGLGLQTLVFAGKEPFLNPKRLFSLLEFCGSIPNRSFTVGVVTNGRQISRRWKEIEKSVNGGCLDFLDISIDSGVREQHDAIRGKTGTWNLALSAIREASVRIPNVRVSISSVLRNDNANGILELLTIASPYVGYFFIIPVLPPPYSDINPLETEKVISFLQQLLIRLSKIKQDKGLEITVSLSGIYVMEAVDAGLFGWHDLKENHSGMIYAETQVRSHTLLYSCSVIPEQAYRIGRITYDGAYLGHLQFLQSRTPEKYATGFLQEESISALYNRSIAPDSRFHRLLLSRKNHECRERPCWSNCFGGWAISDNAFLTGYPLESKPALCPKINYSKEFNHET